MLEMGCVEKYLKARLLALSEILLTALVRRLAQALGQVSRTMQNTLSSKCLFIEPIENEMAVVRLPYAPRTDARELGPILEARPPQPGILASSCKVASTASTYLSATAEPALSRYQSICRTRSAQK